MTSTCAFVLIDPSTGRVIESPSFRESLSQEEYFEQQETDEDLDVLPMFSSPKRRRIPAPEYYAQDGKTPIYKVFKKHPYGR